MQIYELFINKCVIRGRKMLKNLIFLPTIVWIDTPTLQGGHVLCGGEQIKIPSQTLHLGWYFEILCKLFLTSSQRQLLELLPLLLQVLLRQLLELLLQLALLRLPSAQKRRSPGGCLEKSAAVLE